MKKKMLFLGLNVVMLTMCLVSCGGGGATSTTNSSESGGQTESTNTHTHTFASEWSSDKTYHWHAATCGHTDQTSDKAEHTWVDTTDKDVAATETSTGKDYKKCSVCGYETYTEIPMLEHIHTFASEWSSDKTYHWHAATCEHTSEVSDKAEHTWVDTTDKDVPATETSTGKDYKKCSVCGYETYTEIPMLKYQRIDAEGKAKTDGEYMLFGAYPQTSVTDEATLATLNTKVSETKPTSSNAQGFTSHKYYFGNGNFGSESNEVDYMWYKDIDLDNNGTNDYKCVYFDQFRPYLTSNSSLTNKSYQDNNGYTTGNYYFFKYEPIKWKILKEADGKATILADLILDSQDYNYTTSSQTVNGETIYANNYEYSTIRKWLNDNFYNTAFNDLQKSIINEIEVDNSASTTNEDPNPYACNNTNDKVWLLSYQEAFNTEYGFNSDTDRQKKPTDYAKCQGVYIDEDEVNGKWWLRSPHSYYAYDALYIRRSGDWSYLDINDAYNGIVPALEITL